MADMNEPGKEGSRNEDGVNPEKKTESRAGGGRCQSE